MRIAIVLSATETAEYATRRPLRALCVDVACHVWSMHEEQIGLPTGVDVVDHKGRLVRTVCGAPPTDGEGAFLPKGDTQ